MAGIIAPTNFARVKISSPPVGTGGLSFSVEAGRGALFPTLAAGEWFYGAFTNAARSKNEIVKIEARAGDGFTVAAGGRGIDGTVADTWVAGDVFYLPSTRAMWLETAFAAIMLALAKLTPAADKIAYFTSGTAAALADFTAYARSLVAAANAAAARAVLDVFSRAETWSTGDAKLTWKAVADAGWIMANDGSIGSAASLATTRANADAEALYTLLWTNVTDAWAPVSGGRGASAAADFAANKTLTLPKALGRAIAISGGGAGLTARALGQNLGSENAVVVTHNHGGATGGQSADHTHAGVVSSAGGQNVGSAAAPSVSINGSSGGASGDHTHSIASAGEDGTGKNMPPEVFMNAMIKL